MIYSVHDIKAFYQRRAGRLVRRIISAHIQELWPDDGMSAFSLCGYGFVPPYMRPFYKKVERNFCLMPVRQNVTAWPDNGPGLVSLTEEGRLPLETESVDRLLVVHGVEYAEDPHILLHEFWRVLKSNGRLLVVVPNRLGLWARADWTPFGHGSPYTHRQLLADLKANLFVHEHSTGALFMPPFKSFLAMQTAYILESFGRYLWPGLAGVHLVEASKQIYSGKVNKATEKKTSRRYTLVNPVSG